MLHSPGAWSPVGMWDMNRRLRNTSEEARFNYYRSISPIKSLIIILPVWFVSQRRFISHITDQDQKKRRPEEKLKQ